LGYDSRYPTAVVSQRLSDSGTRFFGAVLVVGRVAGCARKPGRCIVFLGVCVVGFRVGICAVSMAVAASPDFLRTSSRTHARLFFVAFFFVFSSLFCSGLAISVVLVDFLFSPFVRVVLAWW